MRHWRRAIGLAVSSLFPALWGFVTTCRERVLAASIFHTVVFFGDVRFEEERSTLDWFTPVTIARIRWSPRVTLQADVFFNQSNGVADSGLPYSTCIAL